MATETMPDTLAPLRVICSCGYRWIEDHPEDWRHCPECGRGNPIRQMSEYRKTKWVADLKAKAGKPK